MLSKEKKTIIPRHGGATKVKISSICFMTRNQTFFQSQMNVLDSKSSKRESCWHRRKW